MDGALTGGPRSVLITGASSGLGLSMAVRLAEEGWLVYATMRDPARRGELDAAVSKAGIDEDRVRVLRLDVRDLDTIGSALDQVGAQTGGSLDALVNNAGLNAEACFEDVDMDAIRNVFDTHVFGAMEVTRAALPLLRKAGNARILFVSSWAAVFGGPMTGIYAAAKSAIERFAESLVWELAQDGIRVSLLRPGTHRSNIFSGNSGRVRPLESRYGRIYSTMDPLAEKWVSRAGDPQDVARQVARILNSPRPGFRYNVGLDSYLVAACNPLIPQRLRYRAARALFKPRETP
jgi:NAD(P)-dependent dehydrogenase (short-subunit alcohol dehydrogenase family)